MWSTVARIILRNRILLWIIVGLATAFMGYQAQFTQVSYKFSRILPQHDTTHIIYEDFKKTFGEVANTVVVGMSSDNLFDPRILNHWKSFSDSLSAIKGVESVVSITQFYSISKDSLGTLKLEEITSNEPYNAVSAKNIEQQIKDLPFYKDLLISRKGNTTLLYVQLNTSMLYNKEIIRLVESIKKTAKVYEGFIGEEIHISGLPHIRMANTTKLKREVYLFIFLALLVTATLLLLFLKSFRATMISMVVVIFGVIWSFGLIGTLGFEITILSSIIPPLVIVIGIPNCIFLINKYHQEYKHHGNKVLALQRVIIKIGNATLLTNTTTALGFASFILTDSIILKEFGLVACINILVVFLLSLIIIPIAYTYMSDPKERHFAHLDRKWVSKMNGFLIHTVAHRRPWVYAFSIAILITGFFGIQKIKTTGNLSDDFQHHDPVYMDLKFLEREFRGVVPLEVVVRSNDQGGMEKLSSLKKMEAFQRSLDSLPKLSRSIAITDLAKFARQAFYSGDPAFYSLVTNQDKEWVYSSLPHGKGYSSLLNSLIDSSGTQARITMQVADIGTEEMRLLQKNISDKAEEFFDSERYDVTITGASVLFLNGTTYIIKNLIVSLLLAIAVISIIMALLFRSFRMVIISLIPNLIPLILTASIMGFTGIPLKPSTILVFSIAFGISVDDTIHFLAKYRQELQRTKWNIRASVVEAIRDTSVSMFYTSVVLFFGFSIFLASEFGGTQALGMLVSVTLILAMFSNLIILPTLLMTLERLITEKTFSKLLFPLMGKESDADDIEDSEELNKN